MRKFYYLLAVVAVAATSCQQERYTNDYHNENSLTVEQTSPYAVSEDEAIERLEGFMATFDCETRSKQRTIKKIDKVSYDDIFGVTRNSESTDIEDLIYIVEFEDGEGSAILGADRRLEPVYAVLDESTLTIEDFNNAANGLNTDDINTYTAGMITNGLVIIDSLRPVIPSPNPGGGLISDMYKDIIVTTVDEDTFIAPMLNTKWEQWGIFNNKFRVWGDIGETDGRQAAGCATIALGQILNHNSYPSPITLNDNTFYWSDINQFTWNNNEAWQDSTLVEKMSFFIYHLSKDLKVRYNNDGSTSATIEDVRRVMRQQGYSNFSIGGITEARVYPMLNADKPVYARGENSYDKGHAWVIDGWKSIRHSYIRITYDGFGVEKSRELTDSETIDYVHCNMGHEGECDGYYTMTLFDLTDKKIADEYEPGYGDVQKPDYYFNTTNYIYNNDFKTLTYDF